MPNSEDSIKADFNAFCRKHIGVLFITFTLVFGGVVGGAVSFYWINQIPLSNQALANELRSQENKSDVLDTKSDINKIQEDVGQIKTDVAVIRSTIERQE